jgi:hypothetical protein
LSGIPSVPPRQRSGGLRWGGPSAADRLRSRFCQTAPPAVGAILSLPPGRPPWPAHILARPPNPEWLGKLTEEILEPDLPIVDPHRHLWDHPCSRYLLDELLADANSGHNIVGTVFIQSGSDYHTSGPEEMRPIGEREFVRAIAEEGDRRCRCWDLAAAARVPRSYQRGSVPRSLNVLRKPDGKEPAG